MIQVEKATWERKWTTLGMAKGEEKTAHLKVSSRCDLFDDMSRAEFQGGMEEGRIEVGRE